MKFLQDISGHGLNTINVHSGYLTKRRQPSHSQDRRFFRSLERKFGSRAVKREGEVECAGVVENAYAVDLIPQEFDICAARCLIVGM